MSKKTKIQIRRKAKTTAKTTDPYAWKTGSFSITVVNDGVESKKEVKGQILVTFPNIGLHRDKKSLDWTVTHIPTGKSLVQFVPTKSDATKFVKQCHATFGDGFFSPDEQILKKIVAKVGRDHLHRLVNVARHPKRYQ